VAAPLRSGLSHQSFSELGSVALALHAGDATLNYLVKFSP